MNHSDLRDSQIAIVGMAGRYPKSKDLHHWWQNLHDGIELTSSFTEEDLLAGGIPVELLKNPNYVRAKAVLEDIAEFDAEFFGFSAREAEVMDPQQRLFLECAVEALENAGWSPETISGRVGVYAGESMNTYLLNHLSTNHAALEAVGAFQVMIGSDKDFLPTIVSYKLNLKGPSVNVQTACSTSLVAVHLACQSLLNAECDMALAGGVSVKVPHKSGYLYQEGSIFSPDGHCRPFDARSQGTFDGNGAGVVVLKRLSDALADGDNILAVIRGSAINNDGSLKVGYTAPSIEGQAEAIAEAMAMARVTADTITCIEAHGTGTPLGDPIEVAALTHAFRASSARRHYCALGSVKSNLGHLDAAAGVTGLIKAVLQLQHKQLVPSLHYERPNPKIDFASSPFYVNARLQAWEPPAGTPRRAGVSSFGIGGTNAHVVVEEAPEQCESGESRVWQLLMVSAKTGTALEQAAANLAGHLERESDEKLADVAYTQQVGRTAYKKRRVVVCRSKEEGRAGLRGEAGARVWSGEVEEERQVGFLFPGQGAQYVNMGRELYEREEVFRRELDRCSEELRSELGIDIRDVLYPTTVEEERAAEQLKETRLTQPVLLAVEWALAQQWMSWGLKPEVLAGHSIGEYAAATVAGVMEVEEALRVLAARGRVMQMARRGAMLSVPLSEQEISNYLRTGVWLSAVNGPELVVLGGEEEEISQLETELRSKSIQGKRLRTSHAFHTGMLDEVLSEFAEVMAKVRLRAPRMRYLSNVSGTWVKDEEATSTRYWVEHARRTVRFRENLSELLAEDERVLLEVGPGNVLGTLARQQARQAVIVSSLPGPQEKAGALEIMTTALGRMWVSGVHLDSASYWGRESRHRVPLPTYPFERQRYWIEPARARTSVSEASSTASSPLQKNPNLAEWFYLPSWKQTPPPELLPRPDGESRLRWLLFLDDCGVGSAVMERLRSQGQGVIRVMAGKRFGPIDGGYMLRLGEADDYRRLIGELAANGQVPNKIVYLWSLTSEGACQPAELEQRCFYGLLALAQALGDAALNDHIDIAVISNGLQDVLGDESIVPEKALLLGPSKVLPHEYQHLTCRSIDIALPSDDVPLDALLEKLICECRSASSDGVIAYRRNTRWVQTFDQVPLSESVLGPSLLRPRGVYLITGGQGGIGLTLAEHLARTTQARLVLISRTDLPERGDWQNWLATHSEDFRSKRIRKILNIEQAGGEVLALAADVCDATQMQNALMQATSKFGPIHGVIHAAGIAGGGLMQIKKPESAAKILAPKVEGTRVLAGAFSATQLDFMALCSSITALRTVLGQVDYTAANCFLDAFAQSGRVRNCVSINWDAWREVGMAVDTSLPANLQELRRKELQSAIAPLEGAQAFESALRSKVRQLLVSPHQFVMSMTAPRNNAIEHPETNQAGDKSALHPRPSLPVKYVPARNAIDQSLIDIWQKLLGIGPIGIHDSFFDLGGHSLLATQVASRVRDSLKVDLQLRQLFEFTTVADLSDSIANTRFQEQELERVLSELEQMPDEQAQQLLASELARKSSQPDA